MADFRPLTLGFRFLTPVSDFISGSWFLISASNSRFRLLVLDSGFRLRFRFLVPVFASRLPASQFLFPASGFYNSLNSYPSSLRNSIARGNAYCRLPLFQDFKESWKVMIEPLRAYFITLASTCGPRSFLL